VPVVLVYTEAFETLTEAALTFSKYGDVPRVGLPKTLDNMPDQEVQAIAAASADEIVRGLLATAPSTGP
jgi:hypothetical protein